MSMNSGDLWATALDTLGEKDRKLVAFDSQQRLDTLSDLGHLVASAKEDSIKERWQFHRPGDGQTVILRDLFSKIAVWIDRFKEIGDIVVQYDPTHAALPWAGVRFLLQIAVSDINKFAFVVEGVETITRSISRCSTFEQVYFGHETKPNPAVKELEEDLVRLYAAILVYLKRIAKAVITPQSDFQALLRNIDDKSENVDRRARVVDAQHSRDIKNELVSLSEDQREAFAKLLKSIDRPICRMSRQLDSVEDQLQHSERVKILEWLSSQPYKDHHRQIKKQALSGSGQWLLQDPLYARWYQQSVSSLLWLHGKPGSGKSTLVSLVIEDMSRRFEDGQSDRPVYFYCTRNAAEPERSNAHAVLSSLLRQLSCAQPGAPILRQVVEKYKDQGESFKSSGLDLDDSRDLIIKLIEDYSMTTIIVDALDECDLSMRQSLLDAFERILKESRGLVKIFVSSRNDQDIVCTLRDYPNMDISSDKNKVDIENYVKTETVGLVRDRRLLRNSRAKEEMTALIIEQLSSGADGMFRWASLQLDLLRALKHDEDIRARLGKLPPKLEELYVEAYNNLISDQGEFGRSIIDNALKWLFCFKRHLYASQFLIAIAANLDTEEDIDQDNLLDLCNNFLIYDEDRDVFRFAHLSVREFLGKKPEFAEISCHTLAAECCLLQIIASSDCPNTNLWMGDAHLLRLRRRANAGFLELANNFWIQYCQSIPVSDRSGKSKFGRIFRFFLSDKQGTASPLNAWTQWHCSRVLDNRLDPAASWELQRFLNICLDTFSKSFLVASYCGFYEVVTSCLRHPGLDDKTKDEGLLLAAMAAPGKVFEILIADRKDRAMTEPLLIHAVRAVDRERLAWLLDKVPDTMISVRVFAAIAEDRDDGKMTTLLSRYNGLAITEQMLVVAVESASLDNFGLLLAMVANPKVTEEMLRLPNSRLEPIPAYSEKIAILVGKMRESDFTPKLMQSAAINCEEDVVEAMVKGGGASKITKNVMIAAAQRNIRTFHLLLECGGGITETVLDGMASSGSAQAWQMLFERGYEISVNVERLKRAARRRTGRWKTDSVLSILLEHADVVALANDMAGLIIEVARHGDRNEHLRQLLDHANEVKISQDMLLAAMFNPKRYLNGNDRLEKFEMFLERSSEVQITEDMLVIAASDARCGSDLVRMFLERKGKLQISEYVLMAAACNHLKGSEMMRLLLEQNTVVDLTADVLLCAARNLSLDVVMELLERSVAKVSASCLLEAAAANQYHGADLVKLLLPRAKITEFPEAVLFSAACNEHSGLHVIHALEETFGPIDVTESLIAKCVHKASLDTINFLLSRVDSAQITEDVFIRALRNDSPRREVIQIAVAEKSLHIPITAEILVSAAQYGTKSLFRFLWNRCNRPSVPQALINLAAIIARIRLSEPSHRFAIPLQEAEVFEIGEETLVAIAAHRHFGCDSFDLLLERGLQADTTEGVPETLLTNGGIKVECSSQTPLRISKGTKVTEEIFRNAASCGYDKLLQRLASFCNFERIPDKWLDISRLYHAAYGYGHDRRKSHDVLALLERGVDPNVANRDGRTPLVVAVENKNEAVVQILLSAGALPDGGPNLKQSPLCLAASSDRIPDIAKLLVNAGASLDFKNEEGQTPSMIAKLNGSILVYKYLEQCRKEQERRREESPDSA